MTINTVQLEQELISLSSTSLRMPADIYKAGKRLEELLLSESAEKTTIDLPNLSNSVISAIQRVYEQYETNLEFNFAARIISENIPISEYPLYERFQRLINSEVAMADLSSKDRVLFIGSGPFPISAILIATLCNASVDCYDCSREACEISSRVISKLELSEKIRIFERNAQSVKLSTIDTPGDYGIYDVIVVALLAQPKENILHQLWKSLGPQPKVILRYSKGNRKVIYKGMELENAKQSNRYIFEGNQSAGVDDTISSLVARTGSQPWIFKL